MNTDIESILREVDKLITAGGIAAKNIIPPNSQNSSDVEKNVGTKIDKIKGDIKAQAETNKNSIIKRIQELKKQNTNVNLRDYINNVYTKIIDEAIIDSATAEIKNLIDQVINGQDISGGGSRQSSRYHKRNQSGGSIDNDIMTYIFRLILQE